MQVLDSQKLASLREGAADALGIVREDIGLRLRLNPDDFPRFRRVSEPQMIAVLGAWVFGIADEAGGSTLIAIVFPFQSRDFCFPPRRFDCKPHHGTHRDHRAPIPVAAIEVFIQPRELLVGGASLTTVATGNQAQLYAECSRALNGFEVHFQPPTGSGGLQNRADP